VWRRYLLQQMSDSVFYPPAAADQRTWAQSELGLILPDELWEIYAATNGVYSVDAYMWIIWPIESLVKETRYMHTSPAIRFYEKSFTHLLFIGTLGNGDLIAIDMTPSSENPVGHWDHEDGEFRGRAPTLRAYFDE